jgi:hypothetical protein
MRVEIYIVVFWVYEKVNSRNVKQQLFFFWDVI